MNTFVHNAKVVNIFLIIFHKKLFYFHLLHIYSFFEK